MKTKIKKEHKVKTPPISYEELVSLLKECRDLIVMCTLIDKSSQCKDMVDKIDAKMGLE